MVQVLPPMHCWHIAPPRPQVKFDCCMMHRPNAQQPVGHESALQPGVPASTVVPPWQVPLTHEFPRGHCWHMPPPVPHAKSCCWFGGTHRPKPQQPEAHVIGPHGCACWHVPLTQSWPLGQRLHMLPPRPQVKLLWNAVVKHEFRGAQQPLQVPGPQAAITHAPLTHCSPKLQRMHWAPLAPH